MDLDRKSGLFSFSSMAREDRIPLLLEKVSSKGYFVRK